MMAGVIRVRALSAVLASLLVASPVLAQPTPPEPTAAEKAKAGDLVKKAIAKSQAGDHAAAIDLYLESYKVIPTPLLLSNIGTEYQSAQKPVEALKYFCMYLKEDPTGPVASYATAQAKVVQNQLGNPVTDDAKVCEAKVEPPPPVKPPPPALPPPAVTTPSEGRPPGKGMQYAGIGVGAAGAVSLAIGVVYGLRAQKISDEISDHCMGQVPCPSWPADIKQKEKDGQSYENIQIGTLILGGALVAVGAVVYVVGRKQEAGAKEQPTVTVAPSITPDTFGVTIGGGF